MNDKIIAREHEIQAYWEHEDIFKKSVERPAKNGEYVFYDGPPFATGLPHYGHLVGTIMKDVVPRYFTMQGYSVPRRWGWDCHGLPIENIVEKELGFKQKKDIVSYGIDKFNEKCREKVLAYAKEWEKTIPRLGRWADMQNAYKTMDRDYMESIWWVFKELWDKGLIYQDYRSMHICPRCETTLSQQEVSEGYKEVKDISVVAKFELVDEPGTFVLAWTTTPWTLPGNVALAIGKDIEYVKFRIKNDELGSKNNEALYIVAKAYAEKLAETVEIISEIKSSQLIGKKYKPLFSYFDNDKLEKKENAFTIYPAAFVSIDDGTGIVHIAPGFGEDDLLLGQKYGLPMIQHVTYDGHFTDAVVDFPGLAVKPIDDVQATDVEIVKYLAKHELLFSKEKYTHNYPHCWRCDTPLLNYATSSWFVKVTDVKDKAIKLAEEISWTPPHIKEGRFGKWLEGARDWSISRQRFWASVIPLWQDDKTGEYQVIGSVEELEKLSGQTVTDLHKHVVDTITWKNEKTGGIMKRVPDVLDTWFDSGSMPYAQMHYPFDNIKRFKENFPAEFIAEGSDQTRAWFYYLHVLGTALENKGAFKNVIVNGIVLAEDGKKMAKKLKNYPDPAEILERYGADALRYYLLTSPVMAAETINFSEDGVKEAGQKTVMLLDNVLSFYQLFAGQNKIEEIKTADHVLDRWIIARLEQLLQTVTTAMNGYDLVAATRPIQEFIADLSKWYVRRSRDRFRDGDTQAIATLGAVLVKLSKIIAPFMPFTAEYMYRELTSGESVHLESWPQLNKKLIDEKLIEQMNKAREIVERGLAARALSGLKVRQPLQSYTTNVVEALDEELIAIVLDELNVKNLQFGTEELLDIVVTAELEQEGLAREVIRQVNQLRKDAGLTIQDRIVVYHEGFDEVFATWGEEIKKATLADDIKIGKAKHVTTINNAIIGIEKL